MEILKWMVAVAIIVWRSREAAAALAFSASTVWMNGPQWVASGSPVPVMDVFQRR